MGERDVKMFGWDQNPFSFKILPQLFTGYGEEFSTLLNSLNSGNKFTLISGPTGSGKTTMLRHTTQVLEKNLVYIPKPPLKSDDWKDIFLALSKPGLLSRRKVRKMNLYEMMDWVNGRLKDRKTVLMVDECHEASTEALEWLRAITDHIDNLSLVMAGLPIFDKIMRENLETLRRRIETRIELTNLTAAETRELIKKRIEWAGGEDISPFTSGTVQFIYERTGGFPREVLRMCNDLVTTAADKGFTTIDQEFMKESSHEKTVKMDSLEELPYRQRLILDILASGEDLTPSQISKRMEEGEYENMGNAVRSINNILKRLMKEGLVERKRRGKAYKYCISQKFQTLFIDK